MSFSVKLISKEIFPQKFASRMVNADWLITRQAKQTFDYVNKGAVDGLLNECIRRFFPLEPKSQRNKNNNNNA